jgi:hypothetical protein
MALTGPRAPGLVTRDGGVGAGDAGTDPFATGIPSRGSERGGADGTAPAGIPEMVMALSDC